MLTKHRIQRPNVKMGEKFYQVRRNPEEKFKEILGNLGTNLKGELEI